MSQLRSAVEEYNSVDSASLTDGELEADSVELAAAIDRLTALLADRASRFAQRGAHCGRGFASATAWLMSVADLEPSQARRLVSQRTFLDQTRAGVMWRSGDLSGARARILASAHREHADLYHRDERLLLNHVVEFSLRNVKRVVRHWTNCADATAAESTVDEQIERSHLNASQTFGGMVRIDGLFDQQTGETLLSALDAAMTEGARDGEDTRLPANRRAEALGHICQRWLDTGSTIVGGRRPHVAVVVDLKTLERRAGRRCDVDHTGTITAEQARSLACDAAVTRVITHGQSQVLDVGRTTRTISAAQRNALVVRDQHCRFQGCERPPSWCDAHHLTHWADGGATEISNLTLLCRRHHRKVHTNPTRLVDGTVMLR